MGVGSAAARVHPGCDDLGIIGTGSLGTALGERPGQAGHTVMFGGGTSAKDAAARQPVEVGSNSDAAAFGDVVILAVPFATIDAALADAGALAGRVVWSCVNALKPDLTGTGGRVRQLGGRRGCAPRAGARVVAAVPPFAKAIAAPTLAYDRDLPPTVFVCGDDRAAKHTVEDVVRDIRAHPFDAGPLTAARYVEPAIRGS
jgi:8-hydroxy-5-deazaflavin:NADPH oxidoreductase